MAQFATVVAITGTGTVFAVNAQGASRALKAGDVLQKGETVRTVGDARVELLMEDGRLLAVAPAQSVRLDENVTESEQRPTAQDSAVTTAATADTIIQALERGTDLSTELEATAAGLGGGSGADGGSSFVQLLRITEGVTPLAYDYTFAAQDVPPVLQVQADTQPETEPPATQPPATEPAATEPPATEPPVVVTVDDPIDPTINSVTVTEGANAVFTVSLSQTTAVPVTYNVALANGTATGGTGTTADYTNVLATATFSGGVTYSGGTITVPAGVSSFTATIPTTDDTLDEISPETFTLTVGGVTGTGNILDNDIPTVFSVGNASIDEGGLMSFTVTRTGDAQADQSVNFATSIGGTNSASVGDFTANNGTLTFAQGQTSQTFTVQTTQDAMDEADETFTVSLSSATAGATVSGTAGTATGTIIDNDMTATNDSVTVYENALDLVMGGSDLASGTVTGSLPSSTLETDASNTLVGNVTGGVGTLTYALAVDQSATGTYGVIQVNGDGTYVYTLTKAYDGVDANNGANTETARDSFQYMATDANGNTTTGTILVNIVDDMPVVKTVAQNMVMAATVQSGDLVGTGTLGVSVGADRIGSSVTLTGSALTTTVSINGTSQNVALTADGGKTLVYGTATNGSLAIGYTNGLTFVTVLTVTADPVAGTYTTTLEAGHSLDTIYSTTTSNFDVSSNAAKPGNFPGSYEVLSTDGQAKLLLAPGTTGQSVNISTQGVGIDDAFIKAGEQLNLSVVDLNGNLLSMNNISIKTDHLDAGENMSFTLSGGDNASYSVSGTDSGSGSKSDEIIKIDAKNNTVTVTETNSDTSTVTPIVAFNPTQESFTSVSLTAVGSSQYRIATDSTISVTYKTAVDPVITITALVIDGDGDSVTQTFNLTLATDGTLTGSSGSDVMIGGSGNETLIGGTGSDTFVWTLSDTGADKITDFTLNTGDALYLKDLLVDEHSTGTNANLTDYLHFTEVGGKAVVNVDADGAGSGGVTQTITLDNVSLLQLTTYAGGTSDATIIAKLLSDGHLKTDV